jgi:endonuclease YncB( thermonuclease family)
MNRFVFALITAAALQGFVAPSWSADLFNDKPALSERMVASKYTALAVSARYCEDTACEPVTLRILSGDTFVMDRLGQHHEVVTIANIQAPSVHARCNAEADAAQSAKRQLTTLLENRTFVLARVAGRKDARSMAFVTVAGRDVGKMMMDRQSALPFEAPPRPWC